jgi:hypothetical protein
MTQISRDALQAIDLKEPRFMWIEDKEAQALSPIKRPVAKIQEAHAEFTVYQAYQVIGQLEAAIQKRIDQNEADQNKIDLFKAELEIVKQALDIDNLEEAYKHECLAEAAVEEMLKEKEAKKK